MLSNRRVMLGRSRTTPPDITDHTEGLDRFINRYKSVILVAGHKQSRLDNLTIFEKPLNCHDKL